ncbi:MAG: hypothetical protein RLY93_07510 [Sumerlaeia bacterium]
MTMTRPSHPSGLSSHPWRRSPLLAGAVWIVSWAATGFVFGPALGEFWLVHLPEFAYYFVAFLPLLILMVTSLWVMRTLAELPAGRRLLLLLGLGAGAALSAAIWFLPPELRLDVQGPLLLTMGMALGLGLSRTFREREWIFPILVIFVAVDAYSVLAGPTKKTLESEQGQQVAELVMVSYPSAGAGAGALGSVAYFGLPDAIVMALFIGLSAKFGLSMGRTIGSQLAGMLIALMLAGLMGAGVPALPYLCGAFAIVHLRSIKTDRKTGRTLIVFLTGLAVALAVLHGALH